MTNRKGCLAAVKFVFCALLLAHSFFDDSYAKKLFQSPIPAPKFSAGREYTFQYDAQTSSGYPSWVSNQRAFGRVQTKVSLTFVSSSEAILQMQESRMGHLNNVPPFEPYNPGKIQPIDIFELTNVDGESFSELLELPVRFSYEDGVVSNIRFQENDQPWSKNIKKAVLNMIQLNLRPKQEKDQNEMKIEQELRKTKQQDIEGGSDEQQTTFTVNEIGIEGECETTYSVTKFREGGMNITKSINFDHCKTVADIAYGMQAEENVSYGKHHVLQKDLLQNVHPQIPKMNNRSVVDKQLLDRSTTIRFMIMDEENEENRGQKGLKGWFSGGKSSNSNNNELSLKEVELLSSYVLKGMDAETSQAMQTVAVARMRFIRSSVAEKEGRKEVENNQFEASEPETLLYSAELESREALFYMFGDESELFKQRTSKQQGGEQISKMYPLNYPDPEKKIKKVMDLVRAVSDATSDEFSETENRPLRITEELAELTKTLRFFTVDEIKHVQNKVSSSDKAERWLLNALAAAGTRNTVKVLVEKIMEQLRKGKDMDAIRASQLLNILGSGSGLPAPSDRIADLLLALCKDNSVQQHFILKQVCWLTFGSVVKEVQRMKNRAGMIETSLRPDIILPANKLELYRHVLVELINPANTKGDVYETVVALKTIGNAGLCELLEELKEFAENEKEATIVRITAIEAMRRMNPPKVRRVLLPIFQDAKERSDVRLAAFTIMMDGPHIPPKHIIDQIAFTMSKEPCKQVKSFVFSKLRALSSSPLFIHQKIAGHLLNALRLVEINEEEMERATRASIFRRFPIFSQQHKEGIFVDAVSMFMGKATGGSSIPTHMSLSFDKLFNGDLEKEALKISFCQFGGEKALRKLFGVEESETKEQQREEDDEQSKFSLKWIANKLGLGGSRDNAESSKAEKMPLIMVSIRRRNTDSLVLPLSDHIGDARLAIKGIKDALYAFFGAKFGTTGFEIDGIAEWNERFARMPTGVGMQLKVVRNAMLYGKFKVEVSMQGRSQMNVQFSSSVTSSQIQKMKVWLTPVHGAGVKRLATVEFKAPLDTSTQLISEPDGKKSIKFSLRVPQKKLRVFALHTLPMTFVTETDANIREKLAHGERVKVITNKQLKFQLREFHQKLFDDSIRLPLHIQGSIHQPRFGALKEIVKSIYAAENHLHADFEPIQGESPLQANLKVTVDLFNRRQGIVSRILQDLKTFEKKVKDKVKEGAKEIGTKIHNLMPWSKSKTETNQESTTQTQQVPEDYSMEKAYKHYIKIEAETIGASHSRRGQMEIENICDPVMQKCVSSISLKRSPLFKDENEQWVAEGKCLVAYPDIIGDVRDLLHSDGHYKNRDFMTHGELEWGLSSQQRQSIKIEVQGELSEEMRRRVLMPFKDPHAILMPIKIKAIQIPFLDKFSAVVDYRLNPFIEYLSSGMLELIKARYYWNMESRPTELAEESKLPMKEQLMQTRRAIVQFNLQPRCQGLHQLANLTIQTPSQVVHIQSIELPRICPMKLVKKEPMVPTDVVSQSGLFGSLLGGPESSHGECTIDGQSRRLSTFDGAEHLVPFSPCYSVIAKDCQSAEADELPRFAILMKSDDVGQKTLKIVSKKRIMEVRLNPSDSRKLLIKINGQRYTSEEISSQQQEKSEIKNIEFSSNHAGEMMTIEEADFTVRFNGKQLRLQMKGRNQQTVCGLCGDYNDNMHNDFRKPNGDMAERLSEFHRSYTIEDSQEPGCSPEAQDRFTNENYIRGERESLKGMLDDYESRGRDEKTSIYDDIKQEKPEEYDSVLKTRVEEYESKICFSKKPIKQCVSDADVLDRAGAKEIKVQFACIKRGTPALVNFQEQARAHRVIEDIEGYPMSYTESVMVHERCVHQPRYPRGRGYYAGGWAAF